MHNLQKYRSFFGRDADFVRKPDSGNSVFAYRFPPSTAGFLKKLFTPLPDNVVHITDGISEEAMNVPAEKKEVYASKIELIAISEGTILGAVDGEDIVSGLLLFLAQYLRKESIFFGPLHTLALGRPLCPNSTMSGFFFAVPDGVSMGKLCRCTSGAELVVSVIPVSEAELAFARDQGPPTLIQKFEQHEVPNIFNPFRKSVV